MTDAVESTIKANGLDHHVLSWGKEGTPVVLCHGFLDIAWGFDALARILVSHGYRVFSFDWRGHGESQWIGEGGYYHFADYLLDLDELLPQLCDEPVHLVGHSMGGTSCSMYGGARSERLRTLTVVEGLGPPEADIAQVPSRVVAWLDQVARIRGAKPRVMADTHEALARMRVRNPELSDDLGLFLAEKGTREVEGGRAWAFDPLHQTLTPIGFRTDVYLRLLSQISVPTLLVLAERGLRLGEDQEQHRAGHIPNCEIVEIADVGHMVHWFKPGELAEHLLEFYARAS